MNDSFLKWLQGFFGSQENPGVGAYGLDALSTFGDLYTGIQGARNSKKQLSEMKRQFDLNYANQRKNYNTQLQDRQAARVAANPGAYQSVTQYMQKNGI